MLLVVVKFGVVASVFGWCYASVMKKETVVAHRSFSQFSSWTKCGKAYQLERLIQAPTTPAWYFVGGSAFHAAVEELLKESDRVRN